MIECELVRLVSDMTRSKVLPAIWVGKWMCWVRLLDESIVFKRLEWFDLIFVGMLRSPSIIMLLFRLAIVLDNSVRNSGVEFWGVRYITMIVKGLDLDGWKVQARDSERSKDRLVDDVRFRSE